MSMLVLDSDSAQQTINVNWRPKEEEIYRRSATNTRPLFGSLCSAESQLVRAPAGISWLLSALIRPQLSLDSLVVFVDAAHFFLRQPCFTLMLKHKSNASRLHTS